MFSRKNCKEKILMSIRKSEILRVPGASLSYTIQGSGPLLLMIAGGGGAGSSFEDVARHLANWYTVVTYDRRGISRSMLDRPDKSIDLEIQSNDAHHLLTHLSTQPAYVFGSSAGALIGLDLVARYPEQVRVLVAHEPPASYLLPAPDLAHQSLLETYHREGAFAALRQFAARVGVTYQDRESDVEIPKFNEQSSADAESFFKYTLPAVQSYRLNIPALLAVETRIVIAGASAGREYIGYRCAVVVAERLGTAVVEFPGHHAGYINYPQAFARRLQEVLINEVV
jgi:pimeloyl-ACP methyl ester carboxylesterase